MPRLADVFRQHAPAYLARYGRALLPSHRRAIHSVLACRTGALGAQLAECPACAAQHLLLHSCRHRACPRCGEQQTDRWIDRQQRALLPVAYYHVVLTIPAELRALVRQHQRSLLAAMCRAAFAALAALCADPKYLGTSRIGALVVLHTWSRTLIWHPHLHLLVPAGGLAPDGTRWLSAARRGRRDFLVPARALAAAFRGRFIARLRRALPGVLLPQTIWNKHWVVHIKRSLRGGTEQLLRYLGRYVHRTALTDKRIVASDPQSVTFRYRDSRDGKHKLMRLAPDEFLRRYLQHTPPRGLHRVRAYGLLHQRSRDRLRQLQLLLAAPPPRPEAEDPSSATTSTPRRPFCCPACGHAALVVVRYLAPHEVLAWRQPRGPPSPAAGTSPTPKDGRC